MKKKTHFVPRSDNDFVSWVEHLVTMPTGCCGISESELAAFKAAASDYRAKATISDNAKAVAKQATFRSRPVACSWRGLAAP
jgi:hypothetical protein